MSVCGCEPEMPGGVQVSTGVKGQPDARQSWAFKEVGLPSRAEIPFSTNTQTLLGLQLPRACPDPPRQWWSLVWHWPSHFLRSMVAVLGESTSRSSVPAHAQTVRERD